MRDDPGGVDGARVGEGEGVGDVGADVVTGDAQGDAGEVQVDQRQLAGPEVAVALLRVEPEADTWTAEPPG